MTASSPLEQALRRDRLIVGLGLAVLTALAITYLAAGAGLDMSLADMTNTALFPHRAPTGGMDGMAAPFAWSAPYAILMLAMWWVMMIAMMVPSAAPMMLLYAGVARREEERQPTSLYGLRKTGLFLAGYLVTWLAFSVAATGLQWGLESSGLLSSMRMTSVSGWLSAAILALAGLYQWTPIKDVCLRHCRTPAAFLSHHWRPGRGGILGLGIRHGAYCVGCCWALMTLMFVGGVMNPVWIAAIAVLVLLEKTLPGGRWLPRLSGAALILWGAATLAV